MYKYSFIIYYCNDNNLLDIINNAIKASDINVEIIVICDSTLNLNLEDYPDIYQKIKVIYNNFYKGIFNSLNYAISICKGNYILISTCKVKVITNIIDILESYTQKNNEIIEFKSDNNYIYNFICICYSKSIFNNIGYFDTYDLYSDWDFKYRITKIKNINFINKIMVNIIKNDSIDINSAISYKNFFFNQNNRLFVKIENFIKLDKRLHNFNPIIYSSQDILVEIIDNELICLQYIKVLKNGKYKIKNTEGKFKLKINNIDYQHTKINLEYIYISESITKVTYLVSKDEYYINPIVLIEYSN